MRGLGKLRWGSILIGVGLLGSLDGILFHQLLQWHSVVMNTDHHGMIFSDGLFHAMTTIALVVGTWLLWQAGGSEARSVGLMKIIGWVLMGGGAFNLIEGIVNHHLLQIHHVKQGDPNELLYDLLYLGSGMILMGIGQMLASHKRVDTSLT